MSIARPIIHVLGTVGSGKGTQVALLADRYQIPAVAAGDLFRQAAAQPTPAGQRVTAILQSGALMPIERWNDVVRSYLENADFSRGYLLDGVVRTLEQLGQFSAFVTKRHLPEPWALAIELSDELALERLRQRSRPDTDSEAAIRVRLAWSRDQTQRVIRFYADRGRVVTVNGDQSINAVHRDIVAKLSAVGLLSS
jgi:adenylate kinase